MGCRFTELIVDCVDARKLADFWSAVLGWQQVGEDGNEIEISGGSGSSPSLLFIPVPEPKTVKNRLHIDVNPLGCDQAEEVERILALGARRIDIGQGQQTWVVLADPEGNEFCVLQRRLD
jgi:hypothetical protein